MAFAAPSVGAGEPQLCPRDRMDRAWSEAPEQGQWAVMTVPRTRAAAPGHVLAAVDWPTVGKEVRRQQRSRERITPTISVYRWWARRPHALIGALLDASSRH